MSSAISRIKKELIDISKSPSHGINISLAPATSKKPESVYEWIASITGPPGTPYEGGIFNLEITIPKNYPFKPPKIKFTTKIYHCNVDDEGYICLDILKNNWSPALTIDKTLLSISSLIAEPNPDDPLIGEIAYLFIHDRKSHDEKARKYTEEYAKKII